MPNWCANYIEITGPEEKINKLYMDSQEGFLETLAPIGGYDYNNAIDTWGTKWEVDINDLSVDVSMAEHDGTATLSGYFESAWSPPLGALEKYLENNNDCNGDLYYWEPAMDFCGNFNNNITISNAGKEFFANDPIGQELDGHFAVIDYLEEYEETEMEEALATPPDVLEEPKGLEETKY